MAAANSEISEKVLRYERFLNDTLRGDLQKVVDERDKIYEQLSEYLQLKTVIESITETKLDKVTTKVDLGCNFYVKALVPDTSRIYVAIGYGFHLEMTLPEALNFIEKKNAQLTSHTEKLTQDAAKIKGHIKFVLEGLREIQNIDHKPHSKPQRDIFQ